MVIYIEYIWLLVFEFVHQTGSQKASYAHYLSSFIDTEEDTKDSRRGSTV